MLDLSVRAYPNDAYTSGPDIGSTSGMMAKLS